jgi:16S rRNA (uracil1498-N3)-methyltransferase
LRRHRIFVEQALSVGREVRLEGDSAHYLGRVLRSAVGQQIVLFNGDGHDYPAEIVRAGRGEILLGVGSPRPGIAESALHITVVLALSRGERMDQSLQKCTELGAAAFGLLLSERVQIRLRGEKLARRLKHWQAVIVSACEQSGRAVVPRLGPPVSLVDWLAGDGGLRLVMAPGGRTPLSDVQLEDRVELAVGPEGGFSDRELGLMQSGGARLISLGPRTLRTETAGPAAVAVLQALGGDFQSSS